MQVRVDGGVEGIHVPILKGGTFFDYGQSSLAIEVKALDEALAVLVTHLSKACLMCLGFHVCVRFRFFRFV